MKVALVPESKKERTVAVGLFYNGGLENGKQRTDSSPTQ